MSPQNKFCFLTKKKSVKSHILVVWVFSWPSGHVLQSKIYACSNLQFLTVPLYVEKSILKKAEDFKTGCLAINGAFCIN